MDSQYAHNVVSTFIGRRPNFVDVEITLRVKADFHLEYFCSRMKKQKKKNSRKEKKVEQCSTFSWVRERKNV